MGILDKHWDKWTPEPNTGCYLWIGYVRGSNDERPAIKISHKLKYITRIVCEEAHGPPPTPKHHAAHKRFCHNGMCVNDEHIYWASPSQNNMDKPADVRLAMSRHATNVEWGRVT